MPKKENSTVTSSWADPDDAAAWTKAVFERAEVRRGEEVIRPATGTVTKRGRPKLDHPKHRITIRVDSEVVEKFREAGPGWQSRMNEALRRAVKV